MDAGPHQATIGVDVDLCDAQLRRALELISIDALCAGQFAAGGIDARHFILGHRAGAVHHQREAGQPLLDLGQHIEMQSLCAAELECAVAGADGAGQRVTAGAGDEVLGLVRVSQLGVGLVHGHVLFDAAQLAQLRFDYQAMRVRRIDHPAGDLDVLFIRLMAGIDHDRAVEPALDAVHTRLLIAVIEMNRKHRLREDLIGRADDAFEHHLVGVGAGALADLDDERRLAVHAPAEQPHGLLGVVDVVGAERILAVGKLKQFFGGNDHEMNLSLNGLC